MQNFRNYRPLARAWGDATRNRCRFGAFRPPNHRFRQTFCTRPPQKRKPQERRTMNGMKIDSRARANEKATGRGSMGRGVEANLDARNSRIAGRSATGGTEVSEQATERGSRESRRRGIEPKSTRRRWCRKATASRVEPKSARRALVPESNSATGRAQVSEKPRGASRRRESPPRLDFCPSRRA